MVGLYLSSCDPNNNGVNFEYQAQTLLKREKENLYHQIKAR